MNAPHAIRRGFTMLEMLVSLALLGALMVALNTFLFSMTELWGGGRDQRLFDQHARAATALVRNAFEQALPLSTTKKKKPKGKPKKR